MDSKDLIQFLKSEPMKFTYEEIEQMMDEELEKDPAEMDTDFIDLCADTLNKALEANKNKELNKKSENKKHIKIKIMKIVAIAAIIIIIMGIAVPVAAKYVNNDTSDKIVQFYEDHFSINLRNAETGADKHSNNTEDLISQLKNSGFENVILPNVLLTGGYTYDVNITEDADFITALVDFYNTNDNSVIGVTITKHKNDINNFLDMTLETNKTYDSAKQLSLNGMDIFVFGNKDYSSIFYIDNDIDYNICLNDCDFDSAIEIAKTLG